ncbi:ataxin-3-like isoform X1 [Frankliniella occidentalis]|uniref:ubiquitinyl hydrolase 1 n=1 Tax=Frankliniella occidentalis TaxID=133901 RepID=A0A9C6TXS3_FRAOC|nr:ataxin-3-like isoform X1 [Frankliniella occidentalis]
MSIFCSFLVLKQEGCLCAQHCLNALLQGPYFTAVDLATLGQQMDEQERERMAENGVDSEEYQNFIRQPSGNMDDSGYFSVQVIASALNVWNLELVPYNSTEPRALTAQNAPQEMQAYICNYHDHWFTIRRLGRQWFNLNSMLTGPQLISDTYLSVYLAQLQHEGYSIFVVFGTFPDCQAHGMLLIQPAVQVSQPQRVKIEKSQGYRLGSSSDDPDLERALSLSMGQGSYNEPNRSGSKSDEEEDNDLQRALQESVRESKITEPLPSGPKNSSVTQDQHSGGDEDEDLQRALQLSLQQENNSSDNDLKKALQMSMECLDSDSTAGTSNTNLAEIRARRLRYLEKTNSKSTS